jgi:MoxR-like ATPase
MAGPVLMHRLILRPESRLRKVTAATVVEELLENVPAPMIQTEANRP